jgi:hypothetical protein
MGYDMSTRLGIITTNMLQNVLHDNENFTHPQNGCKATLHYYKYVTKRTS